MPPALPAPALFRLHRALFAVTVLAVGACTAPAYTPTTRDAHPGRTPSGTTDSGVVPPSDSTDTAPPAPCPPEMALVSGGGTTVCIDRWEAYIDGWSPYDVPDGLPIATTGVAMSASGMVPQGYISGSTAAQMCANAGKTLCTLQEWLTACSGEPDGSGRTYPYGDEYDPNACNVTYVGTGEYGHPVCDYFHNCTDVWDMEHMNDPGINQQPGTEDPAGANPGCVTPEGVYDQHGNEHEWIDDANGTFKGGFYADAVLNGPGCSYTTTFHEFTYHDYSTGFRCCKLPD